MPQVNPIPADLPSGHFSTEVLAAAIAELEGHPETQVGGTLGVALIEEAADQPEEPRRQALPKASIPAVLLMVTTGAVEDTAIAITNEQQVTIVARVITQSATNAAGRALNLQIRDRVGQLLRLRKCSASWLTSGAQMSERWQSDLGDPRQVAARKNVFEFESVSTFGMGVLWTEAQ